MEDFEPLSCVLGELWTGARPARLAALSPDFPAIMAHCAVTTIRYDASGAHLTTLSRSDHLATM